MDQERRRTPRYPFAASAEITHGKASSPIRGRVTELGLNGCYVTTTTPLQQGTAVEIKVNTETDFLEGLGSVAYSAPNEGMGLKFLEIKPYYMSVLKRWLLTAMIGKNKRST